MFEASEALQKPEGTKKNKNKVVPLIFMKLRSRYNLEELDRLTAQDVYYIGTYLVTVLWHGTTGLLWKLNIFFGLLSGFGFFTLGQKSFCCSI